MNTTMINIPYSKKACEILINAGFTNHTARNHGDANGEWLVLSLDRLWFLRRYEASHLVLTLEQLKEVLIINSNAEARQYYLENINVRTSTN